MLETTYRPVVCQQSKNINIHNVFVSLGFSCLWDSKTHQRFPGSGVAKILVSNKWANQSGSENLAPINGRRGHLGIAFAEKVTTILTEQWDKGDEVNRDGIGRDSTQSKT